MYYYLREPGPQGQILTGEGRAPGLQLAMGVVRSPPRSRTVLDIASGLADLLCIAEEDREVHAEIGIDWVKVGRDGSVALEGYGRTSRRNLPVVEPETLSGDLFGLGRLTLALLTERDVVGQTALPGQGYTAEQERAVAQECATLRAPGLSDREEKLLRDLLLSLLRRDRRKRPSAVEAASTFAALAAGCRGLVLADWVETTYALRRAGPTQVNPPHGERGEVPWLVIRSGGRASSHLGPPPGHAESLFREPGEAPIPLKAALQLLASIVSGLQLAASHPEEERSHGGGPVVTPDGTVWMGDRLRVTWDWFLTRERHPTETQTTLNQLHLAWLMSDFVRHGSRVRGLLTDPLTPGEWEALLSHASSAMPGDTGSQLHAILHGCGNPVPKERMALGAVRDGLTKLAARLPGPDLARWAAEEAHPSGPRPPQLEMLLAALFISDVDGLRRFVRFGVDGDAIATELPGGAASTAQVADAAVRQWVRRGLVDTVLFQRLAALFPGRLALIRGAATAWPMVVAEYVDGAIPEPVFTEADTDARGLYNRLLDLYKTRETLAVGGRDPTEIDRQILAQRRLLRDGPMPPPGAELCEGRYRLIEPAGAGGFATVWKAYDREGHQVVAVKILHPQWFRDASRVERFFRGARVMEMLRHPGIVRIVSKRHSEGHLHFFVMEHLDGGDLARALAAGNLERRVALGHVLDIGEALFHAHNHPDRIVHRDVKPQNILLTAGGQARLTDFDLVHAAHTTGGTRTGAALGSFMFAPPELQRNAKNVDGRADQYALAMTAASVLCGGDLPADRVVRDLAQFLGGLNPAQVRPVLARATAYEPEARYPDIRAFCEELRGALSL